MSNKINNPHDKFFQDSFSRLETARSFLQNYLPPEILNLLTLERLTIHKDSFIDSELQEHRSDLLYQVGLQNGSEMYIYLLFEHKSYPDPKIALQLLRYIQRIWEHDEHNGRPLRLVLPLVLYHGQQQWRTGLHLHDFFEMPPELAPYSPNFQYLLYDLSRYSNEELRGSVILRITLTLLKYIQSEDLRPRLFELVDLLRIVIQQESGLEMFRTWLIYLAYASDRLTKDDFKAVTTQVLAQKGESLMGTVAQAWIEEGIEKGLEQGRELGLEQGRELGLEQGRQALLTVIERSLTFRFHIDPADLRPQLEPLSLGQLQTLSQAVFEVDTLAELDPYLNSEPPTPDASA